MQKRKKNVETIFSSNNFMKTVAIVDLLYRPYFHKKLLSKDRIHLLRATPGDLLTASLAASPFALIRVFPF